MMLLLYTLTFIFKYLRVGALDLCLSPSKFEALYGIQKLGQLTILAMAHASCRTKAWVSI